MRPGNSGIVPLCEKCVGQQLFLCLAEDTCKGRPLNFKEKCWLEAHRKKQQGGRQLTKDLPYQVEVAFGMKVMVADLEITNGAGGEVVGIVLHEDEPATGIERTIKLRKTYASVHPCQTFEGVDSP
ncbi:hypothetical protein BDZ97DRAFT_1836016 [Flammula alnicola]|nr:hypothetical protein BDZ97DRAFT_1836016 [Flammula alnicola]